MEELYIRIGNSTDTCNIIIIGQEKTLGSRDKNGYMPNKGSSFKPLVYKDPYSNNINLTYIHATPNINLNTQKYKTDHDVHKFVKRYCDDIVRWDGETNEGFVRSREAFIVINGLNPSQAAWELYSRIETEIHGGIPNRIVSNKKTFDNFIVGLKTFFDVVSKLFGLKHKKRKSSYISDLLEGWKDLLD